MIEKEVQEQIKAMSVETMREKFNMANSAIVSVFNFLMLHCVGFEDDYMQTMLPSELHSVIDIDFDRGDDSILITCVYHLSTRVVDLGDGLVEEDCDLYEIGKYVVPCPEILLKDTEDEMYDIILKDTFKRFKADLQQKVMYAQRNVCEYQRQLDMANEAEVKYEM